MQPPTSRMPHKSAYRSQPILRSFNAGIHAASRLVSTMQMPTFCHPRRPRHHARTPLCHLDTWIPMRKMEAFCRPDTRIPRKLHTSCHPELQTAYKLNKIPPPVLADSTIMRYTCRVCCQCPRNNMYENFAYPSHWRTPHKL
mgnify:CR=1 FL=1